MRQEGRKTLQKAFLHLQIYKSPVLYSVGDLPMLVLKQRLKYLGSLKPQEYATSDMVLSVVSSNRQACFMRASLNKSCGVMPMACFTFRCKPEGLVAAAEARSAIRRSLLSIFSSINDIRRFIIASSSGVMWVFGGRLSACSVVFAADSCGVGAEGVLSKARYASNVSCCCLFSR